MRGVTLCTDPLPVEQQPVARGVGRAGEEGPRPRPVKKIEAGSALTQKAQDQAGLFKDWAPEVYAQRVQSLRAVGPSVSAA